MGEDEQLNWVEKRHRAEKHLADARPGLWRDVCAAMTDASRSFNKLYGGVSETKPINGHRFRIMIQYEGKKHEAEIDFDEQTGKVTTAYNAAIEGMKHFDIKADHVSAFIVDDKGKRVTPDEVSHAILKPLFFPWPPNTAVIEVWP
jgi:hypothetical protein